MHAEIASHTSPGPWVDRFECKCGESFEDFRAFASGAEAWDAGLELLRRTNRNPPGYFPTTGPVVWAASRIKLDKWYERHAFCDAAEDFCDSDPPADLVSSGGGWGKS